MARVVLRDRGMLALATLLAVAIGIALGLLGGGGSILTVPILRYTLHMPAHTAVAGSLFVVAVTSAVALVSHARGGRVRWRTGLLFGTTGMLGAYAAGRVAHLIPGSILLLAFAAMMVATSIAMLRPRKAGAAVHVGELPVGKVLAEGLSSARSPGWSVPAVASSWCPRSRCSAACPCPSRSARRSS